MSAEVRNNILAAVAASLITAIVIATFNSVIELREEVATLNTNIENLQSNLDNYAKKSNERANIIEEDIKKLLSK